MHRQNSSSPRKSSIDEKLVRFFSGFNGFGLILMFWTLTVLMLGGIMLLIIGALNVHWWLFFCGLLSLRLFFYIAKINRECIDKLKPFDG